MMRDEKRIARILEKLRAAWLSNPDHRFGQLLWTLNYLRREDHPVGHGGVADPFHIEDEKFERLLDEWIKEERNK
jgi:hypothetical protein